MAAATQPRWQQRGGRGTDFEGNWHNPIMQPIFTISGLSKQEKSGVLSYVEGERDWEFRRVFIIGSAEVSPNLIHDESSRDPFWNHSMSVADYCQDHSPTLDAITDAQEIQEHADHVAKFDTADNIEGIEHLGGAPSEWYAERLGAYERILTATRNNAFTEAEMDLLLDLIPNSTVPDIFERFTQLN